MRVNTVDGITRERYYFSISVVELIGNIRPLVRGDATRRQTVCMPALRESISRLIQNGNTNRNSLRE